MVSFKNVVEGLYAEIQKASLFILTTILSSFQSNELVIGSADVRTRFLPEAELPECARLSSRAAQSAEGSLEEALKESARMSEERQMQQAISVRSLITRIRSFTFM